MRTKKTNIRNLKPNITYNVSVRCYKCKKENIIQEWCFSTIEEIENDTEKLYKKNGQLYVYRHLCNDCIRKEHKKRGINFNY